MFVAMDVHRNRTQVCVMDKKGNEVRNRNVVNDRRLLATDLKRAEERDTGRLRGGLRHRVGGTAPRRARP